MDELKERFEKNKFPRGREEDQSLSTLIPISRSWTFIEDIRGSLLVIPYTIPEVYDALKGEKELPLSRRAKFDPMIIVQDDYMYGIVKQALNQYHASYVIDNPLLWLVRHSNCTKGIRWGVEMLNVLEETLRDFRSALEVIDVLLDGEDSEYEDRYKALRVDPLVPILTPVHVKEAFDYIWNCVTSVEEICFNLYCVCDQHEGLYDEFIKMEKSKSRLWCMQFVRVIRRGAARYHVEVILPGLENLQGYNKQVFGGTDESMGELETNRAVRDRVLEYALITIGDLQEEDFEVNNDDGSGEPSLCVIT